jgi:predicted PurR-regulated permease PerM
VQVRLCAKGFGGANIVRLVKTLQASGAPGPEDNTDTMTATASFKWQSLVLFAIAALLLLFLIWPASQIFLVAFSAILFTILVDGLAKMATQWIPAVPPLVARIGVMVLMLALLAAFIILVGPRFSDQISQLSEQMPQAIRRLSNTISAMPWTQALQNLNLGYPKLTELQIMSAVTAVFSTVMQSGINLFVTLFIGFYMAISPDTYLQGFTHLIPKSKRERGCEILSALGHALRWWLVGRFASMAIVGVLTTIALQLINMPLALVLGVIAGLFTFVPYIGPIMSAVPAVLVALLESPVMALYVIVIYFVVQFIEGNFITPLLMERAVSLPPAVLLLAQFSMGIFYGLFGVLLATPLTIVLIIMIQMLYVQDVNRDRVKILGE